MSGGERTLIRLAKNGSNRAYGTLIKRYTPLLYRLLWDMVRNRQDVEDLIQDSFMKAYQNLQSFKEDAKFSTWLYRIAYNTGLDYVKSGYKKRIFPLSENENEEPSSDFETSRLVEMKELKSELEKSLDHLSLSQKMAVSLYYYQQLSMQEIADIMGCNE